MNNRSEDILDLALAAGEIILVSGGEIYRVENTIERIGIAYGAQRVDAFATPTGILTTVLDSQGNCCTRVRRIHKVENDLTRLERTNDLSRRIARGQVPMCTARAELREIKELPKPPRSLKFLASGFIGSSFAYIFKGGLPEVIVAFFVGLLVFLTIYLMGSKGTNVFFSTTMGGLVAGLCGTLPKLIYPSLLNDKVIIGSIMVLVPGMAITAAIRDLMAGDLLSGVARSTEALLTAVAVAVGVAFSLGITSRLF